MNFVELVDALREESGASGRPLTTVQNLTGEMNRLKNWVRQAWVEVQNEHDTWEFMRFSSVHVIAQYASLLYTNEYQTASVDSYLYDTFRIAKASQGIRDSSALNYVPWDIWQQYHQPGTTPYGMPNSITVRPADQALFVAPGASEAYNLWYDYRIKPQVLTLDTDVPICPPQHHQVIVDAAMRKYARFNSAPEIRDDAKRTYIKSLNALARDQLPMVTQGYWGQ